jgi:hypothetical protein
MVPRRGVQGDSQEQMRMGALCRLFLKEMMLGAGRGSLQKMMRRSRRVGEQEVGVGDRSCFSQEQVLVGGSGREKEQMMMGRFRRGLGEEKMLVGSLRLVNEQEVLVRRSDRLLEQMMPGRRLNGDGEEQMRMGILCGRFFEEVMLGTGRGRLEQMLMRGSGLPFLQQVLLRGGTLVKQERRCVLVGFGRFWRRRRGRRRGSFGQRHANPDDHDQGDHGEREEVGKRTPGHGNAPQNSHEAPFCQLQMCH